MSDGRGSYRVPCLPVGQYQLTVCASGFAVAQVNLMLAVGQAIEVPIRLTPAALAEAVSVTAEAPLVEAGRTQVGRYDRPHEAIGGSWFNGLTVSAGTRNASWGSARVSYTFSRSLDTSGNAFFSSPQEANDIAAEKGPSDQDQRHRTVISGTIGASGRTAGVAGMLDRALGGFQIGYVVAYATGVPFNVLTGNDRNTNDRPVGVGRNTARQDPVSTVDLRLSRAVLIGTERLEFMLEAFNVLNHTNILAVNNVYGTGPAPNPSFGQPTLAGDPRQLEIGVRWTF